MVGDYQTKQSSLRPQSLAVWHSGLKLGRSSLLMCTVMYCIIKQSKTKPSQSALNEHSLKQSFPLFLLEPQILSQSFARRISILIVIS